MKRCQQQHEQENVWRRGLAIHQFPPACKVRVSFTAQDTMNQEDTQDHPQSAQANPGTATPHTPKNAKKHLN